MLIRRIQGALGRAAAPDGAIAPARALGEIAALLAAAGYAVATEGELFVRLWWEA